jgi:hypothetical protein
MTDALPDDDDLGEIPVDTGRVLLVDPCHLPPDLVERLTSPNPYGVTVAAVVNTPHGDGLYPLASEPGALVLLDPYSEDRWTSAPSPAHLTEGTSPA